MSVKYSKTLPSERSIIGAIDREAAETIRLAQAAVRPIVNTLTPRRTGKTAQALQPRVSRTKTGHALTVRPARGRIHDKSATVAQVIRWVTKGTGIHREGPGPKSPIRPKRRWRPNAAMVLPGGRRVRKVRGQRPNPFIARIYTTATPKVRRVFAQGAGRAAARVERRIG